MTDSQNHHGGGDADRASRVQRVVEDCLARRAAGALVRDEEVIARHRDLMPDLGDALQAAKLMAAAADLADAHPTLDGDGPAPGAAGSIPLADAAQETLDAPPGWSQAVVADPHLPKIAGYHLIREISRGGQAAVYEAVRENTGKKVAIKVLLVGPRASPRDLARFDREVAILAKLDHPNIVTVFDRGKTADGSDFLVMPYIRGLALDAWLADYYRKHPDGPPPSDPAELLRLFLRICDAVNAAHLHGIVHRDLKPSNIRIDERGEPHVLDFGLAHAPLMSDAEGGPGCAALTGRFLGTLAWASPEQARGEPDEVDTRTDVYALGVVLFFMLTQKFPYQVAGTMRDVLNNIVNEAPTPPSAVLAAREAKEARRRRPVVSPLNGEVDAMVLKALSKGRGQRYQNAGEMGKDVTAYLKGRRTSVDEPRPQQRNLVRYVVLGGVALLTAVAIAVNWPSDGAEEGPVIPPPPPGPRLPTSKSPEPPGSTVGTPLDSPADLPARLEKYPGFTNSLGMRMVKIEPGVVTLGSPTDSPARFVDEVPTRVRLTRGYHISATEVTQLQWVQIMDVNNSFLQGRDLPVTGLNLAMAKEFCNRLSKREKRTYRLPSEAEWEYAARAGAEGYFFTGKEITADQANLSFGDTASVWPSASTTQRFARGQPIAVGWFPPNAWGLFDVHGNVWEMTEDCYFPYPRVDEEQVNMRGPATGTLGVSRGGGFSTVLEDARLARRLPVPIQRASDNGGIRVVAVEH